MDSRAQTQWCQVKREAHSLLWLSISGPVFPAICQVFRSLQSTGADQKHQHHISSCQPVGKLMAEQIQRVCCQFVSELIKDHLWGTTLHWPLTPLTNQSISVVPQSETSSPQMISCQLQVFYSPAKLSFISHQWDDNTNLCVLPLPGYCCTFDLNCLWSFFLYLMFFFNNVFCNLTIYLYSFESVCCCNSQFSLWGRGGGSIKPYLQQLEKKPVRHTSNRHVTHQTEHIINPEGLGSGLDQDLHTAHRSSTAWSCRSKLVSAGLQVRYWGRLIPLCSTTTSSHNSDCRLRPNRPLLWKYSCV